MDKSWLAARGDMAAASRSVGRSLLPLLFVDMRHSYRSMLNHVFENDTIENGQFNFLYIDITSPAIQLVTLTASSRSIIYLFKNIDIDCVCTYNDFVESICILRKKRCSGSGEHMT
jgi:hypothetical protein